MHLRSIFHGMNSMYRLMVDSNCMGIVTGLLLGEPRAGAWEPGSLGVGIFSYRKTCAQKCM